MIPFSRDIFLGVVAQHNALLWPLHVLAISLGLAVLYLAFRPSSRLSRFPALFVIAAWLETGSLYYGVHFTPLNWAAWLSAGLFVTQGLLLAWFGLIRTRLRLRFDGTLPAWAGVGFIVISIAVYPIVGFVSGIGFNAIPVIGIDPGPTVLFTLGVLLLTENRTPFVLTIIPFIVAWVGATAGWLIGLPADLLLPPAALATVWLVLMRNRRLARRG